MLLNLFHIALDNPFFSFLTLIAGVWLITWVNYRTGEGYSRIVKTDQSRKELSSRAKAAMKKRTGEEPRSWNVRNGFYLSTKDEGMNGQQIKPKKKK